MYSLLLELAAYLANGLLDVFGMDLAYFRTAIPAADEIIAVVTALGWAILLGNLVFQAAKSMMSGLGFEADDPRELFARTFVFSFLLLASGQICDVGLGISAKAIRMLGIPSDMSAVFFSFPEEDAFSVGASWLLVIIVGLVLIWQIVKLFFEIGERYFLVGFLTITAPLAFAAGGSKSTADIFKGWARMYASMCLMMIMNVVFLKMLLSAMGVAPTGAAVFPWLIFVVAIARAARKIDGIIARIGLNPAITGDGLGRTFPGMLSYMVLRSAVSNVSRSAKSGGGTGKTPGGASPRGPSPSSPPGGGSAGGSSEGNGARGQSGAERKARNGQGGAGQDPRGGFRASAPHARETAGNGTHAANAAGSGTGERFASERSDPGATFRSDAGSAENNAPSRFDPNAQTRGSHPESAAETAVSRMRVLGADAAQKASLASPPSGRGDRKPDPGNGTASRAQTRRGFAPPGVRGAQSVLKKPEIPGLQGSGIAESKAAFSGRSRLVRGGTGRAEAGNSARSDAGIGVGTPASAGIAAPPGFSGLASAGNRSAAAHKDPTSESDGKSFARKERPRVADAAAKPANRGSAPAFKGAPAGGGGAVRGSESAMRAGSAAPSEKSTPGSAGAAFFKDAPGKPPENPRAGRAPFRADSARRESPVPGASLAHGNARPGGGAGEKTPVIRTPGTKGGNAKSPADAQSRAPQSPGAANAARRDAPRPFGIADVSGGKPARRAESKNERGKGDKKDE